MFLLIHEQKDYVIYGGISIFAASASNGMNLLNIHKYIDLRPVGKYNFKRHLKPIGVFFAMTCATTIYTNMDSVMLGFIKSAEDVGYYNAAVKIKQILVSIVTSLGTVLLPRASYYVEKKMIQEFKRITTKALNFVFVTAIPLFIYFTMFAEQGIFFLSGNAYSKSIVPMQIIMPTLLIIGLSNVTGIQILVPRGKEVVVLLSEIAGALVNLVVNFILIPHFASVGAAVGTLIAEFIVLAIQLYSLKNEIRDPFSKISYWKIVLAIIIAVLASSWTISLGLGNFILLVLSATLFFGAYGLILIITKEKLAIEIFNQVIGKMLKTK